MKNYLSTLLLTLAVLLGFHSAVADVVSGDADWRIIGQQFGWETGVEFTAGPANSNEYYLDLDKIEAGQFFLFKEGDSNYLYNNTSTVTELTKDTNVSGLGLGVLSHINPRLYAKNTAGGWVLRLYSFYNNGSKDVEINGTWPGIQLNNQGNWEDPYDYYVFDLDYLNKDVTVILNNKDNKDDSNGKQTDDISLSAPLDRDYYFTFDGVKDNGASGATLDKQSNPIFFKAAQTMEKVRLVINPNAKSVRIIDTPVVPVDPESPTDNTIVFFAGDEGQYMEYIEFRFYKGSELKKEVVALDKGEDATARFWDGRPYFFYASVDNLAEYDGVDFYVEFKSDYVNAGHYDGDLGGKVTVKPASSTWYDKTNWSKFIYSPIEWEGGVSAHVSFQSYLTPKESHDLYHAPRTHVYLCGNKEMSGDANRDWLLKDPVVVELSNGVGTYEIKSVNTESSNPPMFKASWLDYLHYCEAVGGTRDVANDHNRAWATFNLGLIGGYEAVHVGDNQTDRSYFYIRRPRLYNNYSQSDWAMNTENVPNGQSVWLVIDSDPEFKSLTLLTFNPHPTINILESHHEVVELPDGQLMDISDDENTWPNTTTGEVFNGKDSGKVRMAQANRFSSYAQISGIYKLMESTPGLEEAFKKEFNEKPLYNFYMINKDPELGRYDMSELTADMSIGDFAERLDWVSIPNITVGNEAALVVQGKFYVKEWSENDSYWPTAPATHGYDAAGFRSVPALKEIDDIKFNAVTPRLERKPAFAEVYTKDGGYDQSTGHSGNWGLHMAAMMDFDDTDLMFYPDYEFEVNGKTGGVITHNEMEHVHHPSTWGLNDFVPYTDGEEYLDDTHDWSLLTKKYRGYNLSIDNVIDGVSYTKINDIRLKAIFMFPFIVDTDAKIEKYTSPSSVARRAVGVERASIAWTPTMELKLEKTAHDMRYDMNDLIITGVEDVAAESVEYEAEYFNLQGVKMQAPVAPGVYIVRRGEKVTKEIIK